MAKEMREFSLLLKPAGASCNLRCQYCFYLKKHALYPETSRPRMSDAILEQVVKTYMSLGVPRYSFAWQGGEPTLMGLDFFKRATALQQRHGRNGATVSNGLQTNGTLVDDDMARHFAEYNFLLGVSLDGPAAVHDTYRLRADDRGSHADVLRGIETLKRNKVEFNILTLVSQANVARPAEIYRYLTDQGFLYHQYIECVEFDEQGGLLPFSLKGEDWGEFLCSIFDIWYASDTRRVSIRLFDSILERLVDGVANVCVMGTNCQQYLVVEHNGDIYPCDFFVQDDLRLGNIMRDDWATLWAHERFAAFGAAKACWNPRCTTCPYVSLCAGDCQRHRQGGAGGGARSVSALCAGWKLFYAHALDRFKGLADMIRRERREAEAMARRQSVAARLAGGLQVGRNDPCPCQSGRKFKKCCGAAAGSSSAMAGKVP
jgi:uncharacterized protein